MAFQNRLQPLPKRPKRGLLRLAWWTALALLAGMGLLAVLADGVDGVRTLVPTVVIVVAVLGFFTWMSGDSRAASAEVAAQRQTAKPRPDGDLSDVAGLPQRPPWMG